MIFIKSEVRSIAENHLFEQVSRSNLRSFENEIRNLLSQVRRDNGISGFDVNLDYNFVDNRTPNTIEGAVSVSPIDVVEYILINFVVEDNSFVFV